MEQKKEKKKEFVKNEDSLSNLWDNISILTFALYRGPRRRRERESV